VKQSARMNFMQIDQPPTESLRFSLTPRALAEALGVSESSIKRWADEGEIQVSRTAGGHRRIALEEALRFARASRLRLAHPEALGLSDLVLAGAAQVNASECAERLFELLRTGAAGEARGLLLTWYLEGRPLADILDGPIRGAMARVGALWEHGSQGIFVEHRATDIVLQALGQLRMLLPASPPGAPRAVGGAPSGDPYLVPSLGAATLLASTGWGVTHLGPQTPRDALLEAIAAVSPRLVWWSLSSESGAVAAALDLPAVLAAVEQQDAFLVVGGRAAAGMVVAEHSRLVRVSSMSELDAFARGLSAGTRPVSVGAGVAAGIA